MKKFIFPLLLFFTIFYINAQDVKKILTSGKWYVTFTQENGQQPEPAENKDDEWIIFLPDGKAQEEQFGESMSSKWTYSKTTKIITIDGVEQKILKLIDINDKKMVVELVESGQESMIFTYEK